MTIRQIALDTETTGKTEDNTVGDHRIIEIGCVELIDRRLSDRNYHVYLNPEREVDEGAFRVHGMSYESLKNNKKFKEIAQDFIDYIKGAELLIHNAAFDVGFLDHELFLAGYNFKITDICKVTDTIAVAKQKNPNNQVSLDNLCKIYEISERKDRVLHGALLDADLLSRVYLAMTGGQSSFDFGEEVSALSTKKWNRPQGAHLPKMDVEDWRNVVHINETLKLAQKHKIKVNEDGSELWGSAFGPEYTMNALIQGEDEGKKDYAKRLSVQRDEMLKNLLNDSERALLQECLEKEKQAQLEWEDRVKNGIKPNN